MKRQRKKRLVDIAELLNEAHACIKKSLEQDNINEAVQILVECQNTANAIVDDTEQVEKGGHIVANLFKAYSSLAVQLCKQLPEKRTGPQKVYKLLNKSYIEIINGLKYTVSEEKEVIFLPYKASMWDSLEPVWEKANADPCVNAVVIPIPYYEKNADGSFGEMHYEGKAFPDNIPIVDYNKYNFEDNHPDVIYIHNPYDDMNTVTSVHPFFYSRNLKKYTDKLIYIPYFVIEEFDITNKKALENRMHFAQVPAVIYADEIIVQSENIKQLYVESIVKITGENTRKIFEKKIKGTGSPKIEKIKSMRKEDVTIPKEWEKYLYKANGCLKKIVLYNNSISTLLRESDVIISKMMDVFRTFEAYKEDIAFLWRPHPLIEATIKSMRPHLWDSYLELVKYYKNNDIGIYDDTVDMNRALIIADIYYGDPSSLVTLCRAINLPVMIQNPRLQYN